MYISYLDNSNIAESNNMTFGAKYIKNIYMIHFLIIDVMYVLYHLIKFAGYESIL